MARVTINWCGDVISSGFTPETRIADLHRIRFNLQLSESDLDGERPTFVTMHSHPLVDEPYETLYLIQDGLNLELNSCPGGAGCLCPCGESPPISSTHHGESSAGSTGP
jgi:hypothetical protein